MTKTFQELSSDWDAMDSDRERDNSIARLVGHTEVLSYTTDLNAAFEAQSAAAVARTNSQRVADIIGLIAWHDAGGRESHAEFSVATASVMATAAQRSKAAWVTMMMTREGEIN